MKKYTLPSFLSAFLLVVAVACHSPYQTTSAKYDSYRIQATAEKDEAVDKLLQPYRDSLNKSMNNVVGFLETTLDKKQPEGSLGNFMADALRIVAEKKFNTRVDVAFMNYGGIRLTQLAAGPITRGKIFELMPFDNILVLQKMTGEQLQNFLNHIASLGGWPVSGLTMQIKDKKAINGQPLNPTAVYTTANSDYVANGGDDAAMLKAIPQQNMGYLMRDAFFEYISLLKQQGKNISAKEENRVTYAQ